MHLRTSIKASLVVSALLVAGVVVAPPAFSASAHDGDETGNWFVTDAPAGAGPAADLDPGVARLRAVDFDADAAARSVVSTESLALARAGERVEVPSQGDLSLTLFDGRKLEILVSKVALMLDVDSRNGLPHIEVQGRHLVNGDVMASAAFAFTGSSSGSYEFSGGIDRGSEPRVEIHQASRTIAHLVELHDVHTGEDEGDETAPVPGGAAPGGAVSNVPEMAPRAVATIDLLVGYVGALGPATEGMIRARIADANRALSDSRAQVQINILAITPVSYVQHPTDMQTDLLKLRSGTDGLGALTTQRDAIGADLVALIVPVATSAGGVGWIPSQRGEQSLGFSVTAFTRFQAHTLTHELGHNLGGDHDYENSFQWDQPFPFSYGHHVPGVASTVVAYTNTRTGFAPRSLQFSNPAVPFIGHPSIPSGTATADNARSIALMGPVIAAYRDRTTVLRLAGADRFETAAAISRYGHPNPAKVDSVVVATGLEFPDALSAAPLAAKLGAPLLLTMPGGLPAATSADIARLKPSKVIVVGGPNVVADTVITQLKKAVPASGTVERIWGADRYETSLAVVRHGWTTTDTAFLATGTGFADALSAGAAAGVRDAPVILVPGGWESVHAPAAAYLSAAKVKDVYIAGATGVVSSGIEAELRAKKYTVVRHGGSDRFSTSTLIAQAHHTAGGPMYLASANTFPDALAGAAVAGKNKSPLVLSAPGCVLKDIQDVQRTITPSMVVLLGGVAGLSEEVAQGRPCT